MYSQSHPKVGFILSFLRFSTLVIHDNEKLALGDKVIAIENATCKESSVR